MLFIIVLVLFSGSCNGQFDSEHLEPIEWVSVARCRLTCVNEFLVSENKDLTEDACMDDTEGCFMCWRMCELLKSEPDTFSPACDVTNTQVTCTAGCRTACDVLHGLDQRFYASDDAPLVAPPVLDFFNSTAVLLTSRDQYYDIVIYVILYRTGETDRWTQLLSTYEQPIPMYGSFTSYPGLQVRVLTVTSRGVVQDSTLDLYALSSGTTAGSLSENFSTVSQPFPTSRVFTSKAQLVLNSEVESSEVNTDFETDDSATSQADARFSVYIAVAIVVLLLISVITIGLVLMRSNTRLLNSLKNRTTSSHARGKQSSANGSKKSAQEYSVVEKCDRDVESGLRFLENSGVNGQICSNLQMLIERSALSVHAGSYINFQSNATPTQLTCQSHVTSTPSSCQSNTTPTPSNCRSNVPVHHATDCHVLTSSTRHTPSQYNTSIEHARAGDVTCPLDTRDYRVIAPQVRHVPENELALLDVSSCADDNTSDVTYTSSSDSEPMQMRQETPLTIAPVLSYSNLNSTSSHV